MASPWGGWVVRGVLLAIALATFATQAQAQQLEDVVYLKDGSIIRGTIVEQHPGESILIRTRDGNQFRYTMTQIDKMTNEPGPASRQGPVVGRKSPGVAFLLSFLLPGAGQGYNRQWGKAGIMFGGVVGSAVALQLGGTHEVMSCPLSFGGSPCTTYDFPNCDLCLVALFGVYVWSAIDAPISASAINRRLSKGASLEVGLKLQSGFAPATGFRYAPLGSQWTVQRKPQLQMSLARIKF